MTTKKDDLTSILSGLAGNTPLRVRGPDGTEWDCSIETAGLNSKDQTRIVLVTTEIVEQRGPQENYALARGTEKADGPDLANVSLDDFGDQSEAEPTSTTQGTSADREAQKQEGLTSDAIQKNAKETTGTGTGSDSKSQTQGMKTSEDQKAGNVPSTGTKASEPSTAKDEDEFADLDKPKESDNKKK